MGAGASSSKKQVDFVVSINGNRVDTVSLPPQATLSDARKELEMDAEEIPELPAGGKFHFILSNGTPVVTRKESSRQISDSLNDGCLALRPTETEGEEAEEKNTTEQQQQKKESAARPAAATTTTTAATTAGAAASTTLEAIDTTEAAIEAVKSELTETRQIITSEGTIEEVDDVIGTYSGVAPLPPALKELLGSAFSGLESIAEYAPGAKLVLGLCAGIYERFQAQRELSENISDALSVVAEVARHVVSADKALGNINWTSIEASLQTIKELVEKISARGKLGAWFYAKSDVSELEEVMASLRTSMDDANFGMNVELAVKVDRVSEKLRQGVGEIKNLMSEEFAEIRIQLAKHLGVDQSKVKEEAAKLMLENQKKMLDNQSAMQGDISEIKANQEKMLEQQHYEEQCELEE